jgi:hypothetical protein
MTNRKDELISYFVIGRFPHDNSIFIQPLNDSVPETLGFIETLALRRLCTQAGSIPVCTIRVRLENGQPTYYHGFFNEPSPEDAEAKNNALLRIAAGRNGHLDYDNPRAAENAISDGAVLSELGIRVGDNE